MRLSPDFKFISSTITRVSLLLAVLLAITHTGRAQTYTCNPSVGYYKNVGSGYRIRVTGISGANVTFEVSHKTGGTFNLGGTVRIRRDGTNGTTLASITYNAGVSVAGTATVNMQPVVTSYPVDIYCIRTDANGTDYGVWDGPITITYNPQPATPSGLGASQANLESDMYWTRVTAPATMYRLQVRKSGYSWPVNDSDPATSSVPVNRLITDINSNQFYWSTNSVDFSSVVDICLPGQLYYFRVKSAYTDASSQAVSSNWSSEVSFTGQANTSPSVSGVSVTSTYGEVTVSFTPSDNEDSSLGYWVHLYSTNSGSTPISGSPSRYQPLASIRNVQQTVTFTSSQIGSTLSNGQSYYVRIDVFDPVYGYTGTHFNTTFQSFSYQVFPTNSLGFNVSQLHGKLLSGPLILGGTNYRASGNPWRAFYLARSSSPTTPLAKCSVGSVLNAYLNEVVWRDPNGNYVSDWNQLLGSNATAQWLVMAGEDIYGNLTYTPAFSVGTQTDFFASIDPPANTFPTFTYPITATFGLSAYSPYGGLAVKEWFFRGSGGIGAGNWTYTNTLTQRTAYVVGARLEDAAGNVAFAQYVAPIAAKLTEGDPTIRGGALAGPVNVASGAVYLSSEDFPVPGYGVPFSLARSYHSPQGSAIRTWRFNFEDYGYTDFVFPTSSPSNPISGRALYLARGDGSAQEFFMDETGEYRATDPGNFDILRNNGLQGTQGVNQGLITVHQTDGVVRTYNLINTAVQLNGATAALWVLKSIKNPRGHGLSISHHSTAVSYLMSSLPQITQITDAAGRVFTFGYDAGGHISSVTDPIGRNVSYTWSGDNITQFRDLTLKTTVYSYDGSSRLTGIRLPRNNDTLTLSYDGSSRVSSMWDGLNYQTQFAYNTSSTVVTPQSLSQEARTYTFDTTTNVVTQVQQGGATQQLNHLAPVDRTRIADYALVNQVTQSVTGGSTRSTSLSYDTNSRSRIKTVTSDINGRSVSESYGYQAISGKPNLFAMTQAISRAGRGYSSIPNSYGEIETVTDPAGVVTSISYNSKGLVETETVRPASGTALTTSYTYDNYGNLLTITDPSGAVTTLGYADARNGFPTSRKDRRNNTTTYAYDNAGRVLTETDPYNNQIKNDFDDNGNLWRTRDKRGNYTTFTFDSRDQVIQVSRTAPVGGVSTTINESTSYDALGRVSQTTNGRSNVTRRTYNSRGLLETVLNHQYEQVLRLTYNLDGTVNTQTTGSGAESSTLTFGYDNFGRQTSVTDSLGNQQLTDYNDDSQPTWKRDARGYWTELGYDVVGRLNKVSPGLSSKATSITARKVTVVYDGIGRTKDVYDATLGVSQHTSYTYNDVARTVTTTDDLSRSWTNTYDAEENLITEAFPDGRQFSYTWDALNRLDYLNYQGGKFADPGYDADGNMTQLVDHLGTTSVQYDSMGRVTQVTDPFNQIVSYQYDPASNVSRITYPGSGKVVNYTFDSSERMSSISPWGVGGSFSYVWRKDGKPSRLNHANGTYTDYSYDAAGRLTSINARYSNGTAFVQRNLTLDSVANIIRIQGDQPTIPPQEPSTAMTFDSTDRMTSLNGSSNVGSDAAGRMTQAPFAAAGFPTWAGRDWLESFRAAGSSSTSTYAYNGLGQRLSRSVDGSTTRYVLDLNAALPAVLMENNSANSAQRYYIYGLGLLASIDASSSTLCYHFDQRGDTMALTNGSGGIAESYGYSPWGITTASNATSTNPFRFIGQHGVMDEGNGLHFMRARFYSPTARRFLSMDQVAGSVSDPGTLNRWAYVGGSPLANVDPSGMIPMKQTEAIINKDAQYQAYRADYDALTTQVNDLEAKLNLATIDGIRYSGNTTHLQQALKKARDGQALAKGRMKAWHDAILIQHNRAERSRTINGCGPSGSDVASTRYNLATKGLMGLAGVLPWFTPACNDHDVRFGSYGYRQEDANAKLRAAWLATGNLGEALLAAYIVDKMSGDAYRSAQWSARGQVTDIFSNLLRLRGLH